MFINLIINYFRILLLLIFLFTYSILCQEYDCEKCKIGDETCDVTKCSECGNNLKFFHEINRCFECPNLSNSPNSYYTLENAPDSSEYSCKLITEKESDNQKLIYSTKEVVTTCPSSNNEQLGDICYPSGYFTGNDAIENNSGNYECKFYFYTEEKDKFIYKNCLPDEEGKINCPYTFKYYKDKQCLHVCPENEESIKKEVNRDSIIYRCSNKCVINGDTVEYTYEQKNNNGIVINTFCLDNSCPSDAKYYEEVGEDTYKIYKCVDKCGDDFLPFEKKCIPESDCKVILVEDIKNKIFTCYKKEEYSCPDTHPYLYTYPSTDSKSYCLKSCRDTQNGFENEETYFIDIEGTKQCLKEYEGYKIDKNAFKLVDDCKKSVTGIYNDGGECKDSCGEKKINFQTLECIENDCDQGLFELSNFCYDKCPKNSEKKYAQEGKCVECNIEEGFYLNGNDNCLSSCGDFDSNKIFYHNDKENVCYESQTGCKDNRIYKYSKYYSNEIKDRICYKSCSDIGETYKNEYKYICYTDEEIINEQIQSILNNIYFYKNTSTGFTKYISDSKNDAIKECFKYGFKYLLNNFQCNNTCTTDYKVLNSENDFGICYENSGDCTNKGYTFHNISQKICSKDCDVFEIYDENNNLKTEDNCLSACPSSSPQSYYEDKNSCKMSCSFYIEDSGKLKCTDSCEYFKVDDEKNICTEKCKNQEGKFSFYLTSDVGTNYKKGQCVEDCNVIEGYHFSFDSTNDHQPCLTECPENEGYIYYDEKNICFKECKNFYLKNTEGKIICSDNCKNGNYIFPGNICKDSTEVESCPSNAPFNFEKEVNADIKVKKCVSSCIENNFKFYKNSNKECVNNCSEEEIEKLEYNGVCYQSCPDGLYKSENGNKCVPSCESGLFKKESQELKCVSTCDAQYISLSGECVDNCALGENYLVIDGDNDQQKKKCQSSCNNNFYQKKEDVTVESVTYPIYECLSSSCVSDSEKPVYINGTKECISDCGNLYKYNGVCYSSCFSIGGASFSFGTESNGKECKEECDTTLPYSGSDKICVEKCEDLVNNKTYDGNKCVDKCNINSVNKFLVHLEGKNYCKSKCENNEKRFLKSNYICIEKCTAPYNYVVNPINEEDNSEYVNECRTECPKNKPYQRLDSSTKEYLCSDKPCGENGDDDPYIYYYMDTKICLSNCDQLYFYELEGKKYCVDSCDYFKTKKLYHYQNGEPDATVTYTNECVSDCKNKDKYTKLNGYCGICEPSEFYFEGEKSDFKCYSKCPRGSMAINNDKICQYCEDIESKNYIDENGECVEECSQSSTGYIYHNVDEKDCLNTCSDKKIQDNICVENCDTKPYLDGNICRESCPYTKRFFLESDKTCLFDCPNSHKYYIITNDENNNELHHYQCKEDCEAYVPKTYSTMNATFCFEDGVCKDDYLYYEKDNENPLKKKCYVECPKNKSYYIKTQSNDFECYEKCPDDTIHMPNSYECIEKTQCSNKIIKYKERECAEQCSKIHKAFISADEFTYCIERCDELPQSITNTNGNLLLTYDNKCVINCEGDSNTKEEDGKCVCKKLFYFDKSTQLIKCLSETFDTCQKSEEYPISIINNTLTNQCIDYCNGILSSSGYECYVSGHDCDETTEKKITLINGNEKCECKYKYYYEIIDGISVSYKICLAENDNCPQNYQFLIKETNECVNKCSDTTNYKKEFGYTCVSNCPSGTRAGEGEEEGKCVCEEYYYINDKNEKNCLTKCNDDYPLTLDDSDGSSSKQCFSNCPETGKKYLDYNSKKCVADCSSLGKTNGPNNKCLCNNNWYYDDLDDVEKCAENEEDCTTLTNKKFNFVIYQTKECVSKCGDYYTFGNKCYRTCDEASTSLISIDSNGEKKCKCNKYSDYEDETHCLDECPDSFSTINGENKCYQQRESQLCPKEYPLYVNGKCYKDGECPSNMDYNKFSKICSCKDKWHIEENVNGPPTINCHIIGSNCTRDYPYLVLSSRECRKTIDTNLWEFNYILYSSCPENTIEDGNKKCVCNPNKYWYEEITSDDNKYLHCNLDDCPKGYFRNSANKKCLLVCENKYYRGICYDTCPDFTEAQGNGNECFLKKEDTTKLENLEKTFTEKIVNLYKKSESFEDTSSFSSQKVETQDATVEFYGVNKKNKGNNRENIQSDLSYIDISECLEKIYSSNGMTEGDIIILKFDVKKAPENYLINPVEYKFVNSITGKVLDASICEHNSIKISYPLHNLIDRYDKIKKQRKLEYITLDLMSNNRDSLREKLDKGKEIIEKYPNIDIFNINDKIYSDICVAVEVDGKDLLLKDRIDYFYPQMSLCENNCTYNHTDFVNERIYCDCSYKIEFDFEREYSSSLEINYEKVKKDQGSNSNIGVIKCISNLKSSKSIKGNGGFIFLLIVIIIEVALLFIIVFYGISSLLNKLKNKMKKEESGEYDKIEVNVVTNNNSSEKKEKDSQRTLNAPPKRKDYGIEFIPQEYVFLFFNQNEKGVVKKVERDGVPFKTKYNTRILLEKNKNINYDNLNSRGPFPPNQNILVIVDNMNDNISDYIYNDEEEEQGKNKNTEENKLNNAKDNNNDKKYDSLSDKPKKKYNKKNKEDLDEKLGQNPKLYTKNKVEYTISDYDPSDENYSEFDFDEDENEKHEKGFIESVKKEQRLLNKNYEISLRNKNSSNFIVMLFTEIIDKIYITKILLFTRKFDILSLQVSVYILCHTLLLILLSLFYDLDTIEKIWNQDDYPGIGYYLLFGFFSCIIIWIVYIIILCLWSNNDKIKDILRLIHATKKYGVNKDDDINKKYQNLAWKIKFKVIVYSIIEFLLLAFCFIYFVTFCSVFTGTMSKVFKSYGIALIEVLIIKIIYGIVLAILRKVSLEKENKVLYDVVLFMNTYLS